MSTKHTRLEPKPEINQKAGVEPSTLLAYASEAAPGTAVITLSRRGYHPAIAGLRIDQPQAVELIEALYEIFPALALKRDEELAKAYDDGQEAGHKAGYSAGYAAGEWAA